MTRAADRVAPGARRHERPAEPRIGTAARLFVGHQPFRGAEVHAAEHQLARAERQDGRDGDVDDACRRRATRRPTRGRATSASDTPSAAITTRTDDSMSTYQLCGRNQDGRKCRSSQR